MGAERKWEIYTLSDPRDGVVWYVGVTHAGRRRYAGHLWEARTAGRVSRKCEWLRSVLSDGVHPTWSILESGVGSAWKQAERKWIGFYREQNPQLTNDSDGGGGGPAGRKLTPEHVGNIAAALKAAYAARPRTPEQCAAISQRQIGRRPTPETRARQAAAKVGKKRGPKSDQVKANISAALRGKKRSPQTQEVRAIRSAAAKGKPWSKARRAAFEASSKRGHSEETKQKIREAIAARGADRNREIRAKQIATFKARNAQGRVPG